MVNVLVIAGSDSGGGAGIQADLKALAALGVHGCTAITCVTAQNTQGVDATYPLSSEAVRQQVRTIVDDVPLAAVKTGMLYSAELVKEVAALLDDLALPVVVDPVMVATAGSTLHLPGFVKALRGRLLPQATLLTPNLDEASALTETPVTDVAGMERAARALLKLGPQAVLLKGGHLAEEMVDLLYDGDQVHRFEGVRYPSPLHGSGCMYASTIAGYLALGEDLVASVRQARQRIAAGFETAYAVGQGIRVINAAYTPDRYGVQEGVRRVLEELLALLPLPWVPEVGVNLGYALPGAQTPEEVCAIEGRVVRTTHRLVAVGPPRFGASTHIARIILTAMGFDPGVRSAMNVAYSESLVDHGKEGGLAVGSFNREEEPPEASTMAWGTAVAIREAGQVPDLIYDRGGPGKVPMLRILGQDPGDVLRKLRMLVEAS